MGRPIAHGGPGDAAGLAGLALAHPVFIGL
jgi:hypothetical protein